MKTLNEYPDPDGRRLLQGLWHVMEAAIQTRLLRPSGAMALAVDLLSFGFYALLYAVPPAAHQKLLQDFLTLTTNLYAEAALHVKAFVPPANDPPTAPTPDAEREFAAVERLFGRSVSKSKH